MEWRIKMLRAYARENGLAIIKEFTGFENNPLHESDLFDESLNFIDDQASKITIILYDDCILEDSAISKRYKQLTENGKVELDNFFHPCFVEPTNSQIKIWRYLTLPKFIELLHSRELFFSRADVLRNDDRSEGTTLTNAGRAAVEMLRLIAHHHGAQPLPGQPDITVAQMVSLLATKNQAHDELLKQFFISCWHMNEHENFAMWRVYSEPFGVCIQSTYDSLVDSFNDTEYGFYRKDKKVYAGEVKYVDWDNYYIPGDNAFWPVMHKKREFGYERELRCIVWASGKELVKVGVELDKLVHRIYINPYTPAWFHQVIAGLCNKYGLGEDRIIQSSLT